MDDDPEAAARARCEAGAHDEATTLALRAYGEEVYSFLVARMRQEDRAADVFSQACEDLWRSLPTFGWRCSLRTWFYKLARSAAARYERSPANDPARRAGASQVAELADQVRSRTIAYLRTEVKDKVAELRGRLDPEEQMLLVLRVDRNLEWDDIAEILEDDAGDDAAATKRAAARLRQRYQKLKARLRELAAAEGLLDQDQG